ncbi:finTRIM family, member 14, partial [Silurus meridionalis]
ISVDHLQFSCSICLDLLKDPVTTPCGHSFCMVCINDFWDQPLQKGVYSCPQCRETFMPRPVLRRNNAMAEVVEKLKLKDISGASATYYSSEWGVVECDICTGSREKAVKSCLVCLASFCKTHLVSHFESPVFKKHKLVQACKHLQDKVCARHDKLVDFYCRTDQKIICALCMLDDHKGHNATSVASERTEKQVQRVFCDFQFFSVNTSQTTYLGAGTHTFFSYQSSSQAAVEENERIFTELFTVIQEKCYEITELIREQEKVELDQAVGLQKQLEQEIADLKKKDTELELLLDTEDHVHFLQSFQSMCSTPKTKDLPRMTINQHISFDGMRKSLSDLKEQFEKFCKKEFNKINPNAHSFSIPQASSPSKILLNNLVKNSTAISPKHLHASTGMSSGPTNFPLFILLIAALTSSFFIIYHHPFNIQLHVHHQKLSSLPLHSYCTFTSESPLHHFSFHPHHAHHISLPLPVILPTFKVPTQTSPLLHFSFPCCLCRHLPPLLWPTVAQFPPVPLVIFNQIIVMPEPKTRAEFLKYTCELSLDPNTAHCFLELANDNTYVTSGNRKHEYPDHPERFAEFLQVLCKQRMPPRAYWEVEVNGKNGVSIAVSYKSINRKGSQNESRFGHNTQSWRLVRYPKGYCFWQNNTKINVSGPISQRIGVYLDQKAGTLSIYSVSDKMTLIHKVTTAFTQPLYAGFGIGTGSSAKIYL